MDYGKIVRFDTDKGYGFIKPDRGGADVFVHVSALHRSCDSRQLVPEAQVSYDEADSPRGVKAVNVRIIPSSEEQRWPEYAPEPLAQYSGEYVIPLSEAAFREVFDALVAQGKALGWL